MRTWNKTAATVFAVCVCAFNWIIYAVLSFSSGVEITLREIGISFRVDPLLAVYASLVPAFCCFFLYRESRASLFKMRASPAAYGIAVALGCTPCVKYWISGNPQFAWSIETALHFVVQFVLQLFAVEIWNELVWRGCFLQKVRTFTPRLQGIIYMATAFTIWQGGPIMLAWRQGTPPVLLIMLPFIYFSIGVSLGSVFEMSGGSIWPCIFSTTLFDAWTHDYFVTSGPVNRVISYAAELLLLVVTAILLLWATSRRVRDEVDQSNA